MLVVAAAGNEGHEAIAYPARAPDVVSVGATTEHGCLASYSNDGSTLSLVAPGRRPRRSLPGDPNCRPEATPGRHLPGHLHRQLTERVRHPVRLRRHIDGHAARRRHGCADHRQRRDRTPSDAGADHRAPAGTRASSAAAATNASTAPACSTPAPPPPAAARRRRGEGQRPVERRCSPPSWRPRAATSRSSGGGIVGLAVARELLPPSAGLGLRARARARDRRPPDRAQLGGDPRRDLLHAGLAEGTPVCPGRPRVYEYCERHGIATERCGKLILAVDRSELAAARRARAPWPRERGQRPAPSGSRSGIEELEPHARGIAGLHSPETGSSTSQLSLARYAADIRAPRAATVPRAAP